MQYLLIRIREYVIYNISGYKGSIVGRSVNAVLLNTKGNTLVYKVPLFSFPFPFSPFPFPFPFVLFCIVFLMIHNRQSRAWMRTEWLISRISHWWLLYLGLIIYRYHLFDLLLFCITRPLIFVFFVMSITTSHLFVVWNGWNRFSSCANTTR